MEEPIESYKLNIVIDLLSKEKSVDKETLIEAGALKTNSFSAIRSPKL
jgi:hypothetical protein